MNTTEKNVMREQGSKLFTSDGYEKTYFYLRLYAVLFDKCHRLLIISTSLMTIKIRMIYLFFFRSVPKKMVFDNAVLLKRFTAERN